MSKAYWNGPGDTGQNRDDDNSGETAGSARRYSGTGNRYLTDSYRNGYIAGAGYDDANGYGRYSSTATDTFAATDTGHKGYSGYGTEIDGDYEDYDDYDDYGYRWWHDPRWRWIAAVAGAILLVAIVAIGFTMRGGDSMSTPAASSSPSTTPAQDALSTTPRTVIATVPPSTPAPPPPAAALPPETIVTVTNPPSAQATQAPPPPLPEGVPPGPSITYTVTGTRQLFDLVTIIYSDEQGFPRTDINVALPWTKTVVLNPGVSTKSVTATSLTGQLDCTITDAGGATVAVQNSNAPVTSCNG